MTMTVSDRTDTRIPNLPMGQIVEDNGFPTDDELTFRQVLITNLQRLFGNEGMVLPSLSYNDIVKVVTNQNANGQYTCAYGTMFYSTGLPPPNGTELNGAKVWVAIEDKNNPGKPILKEVNLL